MCLDWIVQRSEDEREDLPVPEAERNNTRAWRQLRPGQAFIAKFLRRRQPSRTRFIHGAYPRSTATGIRRRRVAPQRPRKTLEDLRPIVADVLRINNEISNMQGDLEREEDDHFGPMLPDEYEEGDVMDQFLTQRRERLEGIERLKAKEEGYHELVGDILGMVIGENDQEVLSEAFNKNVRSLYAAFKASSSTKRKLEDTLMELKTAESRLERQMRRQEHGSNGWRWSERLHRERLRSLRSKAQKLQDISTIRARILESSQAILFNHDTTTYWANTSKSEEAVKRMEQYADYIGDLVEQREGLDNWRGGYPSYVQTQPAETPSSELARGYLEAERNFVKYTDKVEYNFLLARRLALEAGATILDVPERFGDDPLSEPANTIAGDRTESEAGIEFRTTDRFRQRMAKVDEWNDQIFTKATLSHDMAAPLPSDVLSDLAVFKDLGELRPEECIDDRDVRPRMQAKIFREEQVRARLRQQLDAGKVDKAMSDDELSKAL